MGQMKGGLTGLISFFQHLTPVSGSEGAMRSRARLSNRLCSVPEKHSVVSFVQDIRRAGLNESERRSSSGNTITPVPRADSKNTLEPGDAADIIVKRRGKHHPQHMYV